MEAYPAWERLPEPKRSLLWGSFLLWVVMIIVFAHGASISAFHCFCSWSLGAHRSVAMITTTAVLLHRAGPGNARRVMGLRGLAMIPFWGNLVGGALSEWSGVPMDPGYLRSSVAGILVYCCHRPPHPAPSPLKKTIRHPTPLSQNKNSHRGGADGAEKIIFCLFRLNPEQTKSS